MIVRLKVSICLGKYYSNCSFNSMIVRLKATLMDKIEVRKGKFQFYDSPIKSLLKHRPLGNLNMFQFYDSPIKSRTCASS